MAPPQENRELLTEDKKVSQASLAAVTAALATIATATAAIRP